LANSFQRLPLTSPPTPNRLDHSSPVPYATEMLQSFASLAQKLTEMGRMSSSSLTQTPPVTSTLSHLSTSQLPNNLPLFAFSTPSGPRSLTKTSFLARCNQVWSAFGYPRTTGHSFRIGGTTELLTSGIPPDVVKSMGRWSSNSFLRYWRDLETIVPLHTRKARRRNHRQPS